MVQSVISHLLTYFLLKRGGFYNAPRVNKVFTERAKLRNINNFDIFLHFSPSNKKNLRIFFTAVIDSPSVCLRKRYRSAKIDLTKRKTRLARISTLKKLEVWNNECFHCSLLLYTMTSRSFT